MDLKDKKETKWKNKNFIESFKCAFFGFITAFKNEKNMRVHFLFGMLAIGLGLYLKVSLSEWFWLLLAIFLVIFAELINSAIEEVVDLASEFKENKIAKKAKDMAAASVLAVSIFAICIGLLVFMPKILLML